MEKDSANEKLIITDQALPPVERLKEMLLRIFTSWSFTAICGLVLAIFSAALVDTLISLFKGIFSWAYLIDILIDGLVAFGVLAVYFGAKKNHIRIWAITCSSVILLMNVITHFLLEIVAVLQVSNTFTDYFMLKANSGVSFESYGKFVESVNLLYGENTSLNLEVSWSVHETGIVLTIIAGVMAGAAVIIFGLRYMKFFSILKKTKKSLKKNKILLKTPSMFFCIVSYFVAISMMISAVVSEFDVFYIAYGLVVIIETTIIMFYRNEIEDIRNSQNNE